MKTILSIAKKIVILLIVLFIPISLLVATSYLSFNSIPLWNIGLRNIVRVIINLIIPILFIDYIISTTLVISFTDKMLLKPLAKVHIGAIIPAIIILSFYYIVIERNYPLKISEREIYTGYLTYLKPESFNEIDGKIVFMTKRNTNRFDVYILDKSNGKLKIFKGIKPSYREERGSFYLDKNKNKIIFYSKSSKKNDRIELSLTNDFKTQMKVLTPINKIIDKTFIPAYKRLTSDISALPIKNRIMIVSALILSIIVFIIPICYLMNDALWGLSGVTGVILVITLLPILLLTAEKLAGRLQINILGSYNFLLLPIIACIPGILIDVGIMISKVKK